MKKVAIAVCAMLTSISAFAYYGGYGYSSHDDEMSGFAIFTLIVMIAYIILSIVVLVRWFKMTSHVEKITKLLTNSNPELAYLIATGETEKAKKTALTMIVDLLYPIYSKPYYNRAESMNSVINHMVPKIERLGIELPDYVKSGEKFIDYMNGLTGNKVPYQDKQQNNYRTDVFLHKI